MTIKLVTKEESKVLEIIHNSFLKEQIAQGYKGFDYSVKLFVNKAGLNEIATIQPTDEDVLKFVTEVAKALNADISEINPMLSIKSENFIMSVVVPPIVMNCKVAFHLQL